MKYLLCILLYVTACSQAPSYKEQFSQAASKAPTYQSVDEFQSLLDSMQLSGSILIYHADSQQYYSNDFQAAKIGHLPASTFKIPNSLIALETGVVDNDSTLFKWDGEDRYLDVWEQDLIFQQAFQLSCVPCYQQIARAIGPERMNTYLDTFQYGSIFVDSSNIDMFWLSGNSRITQFEQIDFLERLYHRMLPIQERNYFIFRKMMILDQNDGYILSGKTGWSISEEEGDNGWFVGFLEKGGEVYFFATNISPEEGFDMSLFGEARKQLTYSALGILEII